MSKLRGEPICKCGHLRSRHGTRECRCKKFRAARWTQAELDRVNAGAAELEKQFGIQPAPRSGT